MSHPTKRQLLSHMLRVNGLRWTSYVLLYAMCRRVRRNAKLPSIDRRLRELERAREIPGVNAASLQRLIWETWDWTRGGDEWTESDDWKRSVIEHVMTPLVRADSDVLEIGPGAGRWTESLIERARTIWLVDISETCIDICKKRFGHYQHVNFAITAGSELSVLDDDSLDIVWSFDVFVHIAPDDIAAYLGEIARVLRPGGRAVIHHADKDGLGGGWRSDMSASRFRLLADSKGLDVVTQFDSWGDEDEFGVGYYSDVISVVEKGRSEKD